MSQDTPHLVRKTHSHRLSKVSCVEVDMRVIARYTNRCLTLLLKRGEKDVLPSFKITPPNGYAKLRLFWGFCEMK
nr:MAG TPA: hypothetical protein [Caudoviricetes sp.]